MTEERYFYVCDRCGLFQQLARIPEGDEWTCDVCSSHAAWEYPPDRRDEARIQSGRIYGAQRSGLFRERVS